MRLARAFDRQDDPAETALRRLLTPIVKYWICKRGPPLAAEAMEVLGGNGYVEECPLPRLYREMPVNSIWEGSGNVMCLDVMRAAQKSPEALALLEGEIAAARGGDARLDRAAADLRAALAAGATGEEGARALTERLAIALQASLLVRFAPPEVAEAFCAARLGDARGLCFGTLPPASRPDAIIARAAPAT
jgi:putative acyl-CoA dehydrogenase